MLGNMDAIELLFMLLIWSLPFALAVWFIKTVGAMARAQQDIARHLAGIERRLDDRPPRLD